MGRRPSDQEPRQADDHNPRLHRARPVPPPRRADCAARGQLAGRRPVLHGVCADQHHGRQREQDACDGFVPRCVQGDRPRDPVQLVLGLQDVHEPRSLGVQVLGWVESWSGMWIRIGSERSCVSVHRGIHHSFAFVPWSDELVADMPSLFARCLLQSYPPNTVLVVRFNGSS
jgi:hypothetical protein